MYCLPFNLYIHAHLHKHLHLNTCASAKGQMFTLENTRVHWESSPINILAHLLKLNDNDTYYQYENRMFN